MDISCCDKNWTKNFSGHTGAFLVFYHLPFMLTMFAFMFALKILVDKVMKRYLTQISIIHRALKYFVTNYF